ncbi:MAG: hypothetical protein V2A79_13615 [Planctomycetota bacterium]
MSGTVDPLDWPDDPVVAEVRAIRAQLWKEGGGTVAGLVELIRRRTQESESAGRSDAKRGRRTRRRGPPLKR